jgi:tetratricopeptide (TPR) repeat protein
VRISAQLIDATTDHHLWAERYDRPLKDIFAVQDEIRRKIVVHLALKLTDTEEERLEHTYTTSPEAYDALLRGKEQMWRFTKEANLQARLLFERAIELDTTYAVAYLLLGATYLNEWTWQWNQDPQSLEQALALAQQALALDESLPYAHELVGWVYLWKDKQPEQAVPKMKRAIALSPNFYSAYAGLGTSLNYAGRPVEAIAAMEQAMRLNPRNPRYLASYLTVIGMSYGLLEQYEEALAAFKRALDCLPFFPLPHLFLAGIYSELGQEEKARAEATEVRRLHPAFSLEGLKQRLPYKDPAESERLLAALRKAGLK